MIDFRYHLVSIVAVFLALSIGIVIGATELRAPVANRLTSEAQRVAKANSQLVAQNHQLTREINADNAFGQASASYLLSHLLEGQKVVLVTAPGADTTTVTGITTALRLSGAIVIGQVNLTPQFLDKGRPGMASAILTRMRVGDKIVEPKGVSRLYHSRISNWWLVLLVLAAAVTIFVAMWFVPAGRVAFTLAGLKLNPFWHWLTGLFH